MVAEIYETPEVHHGDQKKTSSGISHDVEKVQFEQMEESASFKGDKTDFTQIDGEVAKYTSGVRTVIDEATNKRLRQLIDRRVLAVMILTYFLQALDKGTLSFASIMGIQKDTHLVGQQVHYTFHEKGLSLLLTSCSTPG